MYETHTTQEGDKMLIAQMEDSHLINTIKRVCKRMNDCRLSLTTKFDFEGSAMLSIVNPKYSQERVKEEVSHIIKRDDKFIQPYIVEACLRGLNVSGCLQNAYGRDSVIPNMSHLLVGSTKDNYPEFNEDDDPNEEDYDYEKSIFDMNASIVIKFLNSLKFEIEEDQF